MPQIWLLNECKYGCLLLRSGIQCWNYVWPAFKTSNNEGEQKTQFKEAYLPRVNGENIFFTESRYTLPSSVDSYIVSFKGNFSSSSAFLLRSIVGKLFSVLSAGFHQSVINSQFLIKEPISKSQYAN